MIDRDELAAWLRLLETPRLGRDSARRLLAAFGSPEAVMAAHADDWRQAIGPHAAAALATRPDTLDALTTATLTWLNGGERRQILTVGDPGYPQALLQAADPPLLLYVQGDGAWLRAESIAIVGSRHATPQGIENARAFARQLSDAGLTVVSGLAGGIDGAAHEGGLEGAGCTVAVVGTGLDQVYPRRHLALAGRIATRGAIVSEYAIGAPPLALHFPARNRIIAGLSRGTLVIEAALKSGSLITARLANEAGRDVFAIPGSIHSPQSRGCHALIQQGAKLVECAQDILEELQVPASAARLSDAGPAAACEAEDPLLAALGFDPIGLESLVGRTGWPAATLNARLLELELDGRVARLPGQLFQRIAHA